MRGPQLLRVCSGHEANITCLKWGVHDTKLYSSDEQGELKEWNLGQGAKITCKIGFRAEKKEWQPNAYTALATTKNAITGDSMLAASCLSEGNNTSILRVWWNGNVEEIPISILDIEVQICALEFGPSSVLCAATTKGSILIYSWYLFFVRSVMQKVLLSIIS